MGKAGLARAVRFLTVMFVVAAPLAVAAAAFADPSIQSTASVSTAGQLRDEWGDTANTVITLTDDIELGTGSDLCLGDPYRGVGGSGIVVDGQGLFGITNTCEFGRILLDEGAEQVTLTGLTHFDSGFACGAGGGLYANGSVVIEGSSLSDSVATNGAVCNQAIEFDPLGGGVYSGSGGITVTDSTFTGNHADLAGGGFAALSSPTVSGSTFTENSAGVGGTPSGDDEFDGAGFASLGAATVSGSTFTGNFFGDGDSTCEECSVSGAGFWTIGGATVHSSTFSGNLADCDQDCGGAGGAISSLGDVVVDGSSFRDNNAGCDGGCEALGGAIFAPSTEVTGSSFADNVAGCSGQCDNLGGAIFTGGYTVAGSTFTGNAARCASECAAFGGAIASAGLVADATSYAPEAQARSTSGWGGADGPSIAAVDPGVMTISQSTFSGNAGTCDDGACGASGGALFVIEPESLSIDSSTFDHNVATFEGGAIDLQADLDPPVSLTNSTVTQNTSGEGGAVVFNAGPASIAYDTIVQNIVEAPPTPEPFAVTPANLTASEPVFFATIIALPIGSSLNCDVAGDSSQGYNFSDDASCGFDQATDKVTTPNDPGLGALGANGGPTPTMLPQTGSPVIDAIPAAACQTGIAAGIAVDQRGVTRPQGPGCDIGAVEVEVLAPTPAPTPSPAVVITPKFTG
jgi:hypothetical protein